MAGLVLLIVTASVLWNVVAPSPEWHSVGQRYLLPFVWVVIAATWILRFVFGTARPVGDVMIAADRLAAGDYSARVKARGWGEVRGLIYAFNEMAEQLEANEEQRRALLAEIAHELRTPLTVIHGDVEGMLDGVYPRDEAHLQPALDATLRMTRLLEDLQMLSTAEAGALRLHREPTDLTRLVNEVVAAFAPQAAAREHLTLGRHRGAAGARRRSGPPAAGVRQPGRQRAALHVLGRLGGGRRHSLGRRGGVLG